MSERYCNVYSETWVLFYENGIEGVTTQKAVLTTAGKSTFYCLISYVYV